MTAHHWRPGGSTVADDDSMTSQQVAGYLGTSVSAAHKWLRVRRIKPHGRQSGVGGQNLYDRKNVLGAKRNIRGQWRRDP